MPDKIAVILNNNRKKIVLCVLQLKAFFVIPFLIMCSFLLEVITFMPELAPFPTSFF